MKNDIASPGKDGMIPEREAGMDWADQQRFRLTRGLVYLSIVIGILLFLRSFTDEKPLVGMAVSILVAVLALTALGCLYHGKITSSKVIIAITANLAVFLISLDAPIEKATYLLYIPNSMAAFLVFSGRQRLLTIVFGVAPVLFCLATFMLDDTVSHPFARDFFFNFMAAAACVLFQMFFLVSFHSKAELKAREKESNLNATIQSLNDLSHNMDRLIYSSSHDLRAPIATLKGLVYLLQDREQDIAKDLPDYLSKMEGTISRMDRIVSDLKYYSETKLGHATRMVFDLKSISEEVINDLELAMKENVTIVNEVAPILIETDREGLKFALKNVLMNSVTYKKRSTMIHEVKIFSDVVKGCLRLRIEDTGIGIAKEESSKIFDMFYKGSELSTGTGLGLFLTKTTLTRMGWGICVDSDLDQGTVVTITASLPEVLPTSSIPVR